MSQQITNLQYKTSNQTIRNLFIKINLLDFDYFIVDNLEGYILDGNVSVNADSDIRRTCNITFVVKDSSFNIEAGGKIWLDKLLQISCGVEDLQTGEISWNDMGIFLINQPNYSYDAETKTMKIQGVDLMARLTGLRNGVIPKGVVILCI